MNAGLWQDQQVRTRNLRDGWALCEHCNGTGNELYSMYRECPECGGSGQAGATPWKVRLRLWWGRKRSNLRHTDWGGMARWALSYYLGVGHWFRDQRDRCHLCDALPSDVDYEMRRVGVAKAECTEPEGCKQMQAELEAPDDQP